MSAHGRSRPKSSNKRIEAVLKLCERAGARVDGGGSHHYKVWPADGKPMFTLPTTVGDGRQGAINSRLRRAGILKGKREGG